MKKVMNQSTMTKLLNIGSIVMTVMVVILFLFSAYINILTQEQQANRYNLVENAKVFMDASSQLTSDVRNFAATADEAYYESYMKEINVTHNRETGLANMREIGLTAEEEQMIQKMMDYSNALVPLETESMAKVKSGDVDAAVELVLCSEYNATVDKIKGLQVDFKEEIAARTNKAVKDYGNFATLLQVFAIILVLGVIGAQVITSIAIDKRVISPLKIIKTEMEEISKGNLSHEMPLEPDTSEIGTLVYAINQTKSVLHNYIGEISEKLAQMADGDMRISIDHEYIGDFAPFKTALETISESLCDVIHQIQISADQVLAGAGQVSDGAQGLAQGATEQASSVQELAATIDDVAASAKENVNIANAARANADKAGEQIKMSNEQIHKMNDAMNDIHTSSEEIAKIIKAIEDIAFQTNILALNAAVEAARAGAAGKGFAVVADEVRNLAAKSAEASKNTAALIENSINAVRNGNKIVGEVTNSLKETTDLVLLSVEDMDKLAEAVTTEAEYMGQVAEGLDQISAVVQTNSATSEQSAATSEELSSQAQLLKVQTARFRL